MLDFPLSALPPNSQKVRLNRKQEVGAGGGWLAGFQDRSTDIDVHNRIEKIKHVLLCHKKLGGEEGRE